MDKYHWTEHAKFKMKFYGLSPQRVLRVIRNPQRIEEGIVEKTIAVMQPSSTRALRSSTRGGPTSNKIDKNNKITWSSEIWAMYQLRGAKNQKTKIKNQKEIPQTKNHKLRTLTNHQIRIISAWRYPGVSPKKNPIPEEILHELVM
jgi:hypothetical protein